MSREIYVFADWEVFEKPTLIGVLCPDVVKGKEHFSFAYDDVWLQSEFAQRSAVPGQSPVSSIIKITCGLPSSRVVMMITTLGHGSTSRIYWHTMRESTCQSADWRDSVASTIHF